MSTAMGDRVPARKQQRMGKRCRQILTTAPEPDERIGMLLVAPSRAERVALTRAARQLRDRGLVRTETGIERFNLPAGVEPGTVRVRVWLTPAGEVARTAMGGAR
jgi:hypothetical protein